MTLLAPMKPEDLIAAEHAVDNLIQRRAALLERIRQIEEAQHVQNPLRARLSLAEREVLDAEAQNAAEDLAALDTEIQSARAEVDRLAAEWRSREGPRLHADQRLVAADILAKAAELTALIECWNTNERLIAPVTKASPKIIPASIAVRVDILDRVVAP